MVLQIKYRTYSSSICLQMDSAAFFSSVRLPQDALGATQYNKLGGNKGAEQRRWSLRILKFTQAWIFFTFFAETKTLLFQGPVTRDFWKSYKIRPRYSTFKPAYAQGQWCGSGMFSPDPGCRFLPIPDPGSWISDLKNSNKREDEKKVCCNTFFCSHKFHKIELFYF